MSDLKQLSDQWVMRTYNRLPVTFVRGEAAYLWDDEGKKYLDFVAGIAVTSVGHSHPKVAEAITKQAAQLTHVSNLYYTVPMAELAERLCRLLSWTDGRVFFANSGAEANECAIKLVRKWARRQVGEDRFETIAALGSFHGRTFETLAATGQPSKWEGFTPLPPGFVHVRYNDAGEIEKAVSTKTAAVMLEPVLGEGGVVVPDSGYLTAVRQICDSHNLAWVDDEVQTGLGRCGAWFAFQETGATPDVITLAKALGGGLPLGACIARGELATTFGPGDHATTVGAGPVVCAAALAILDVIEEEGLVDRALLMGKYLNDKLQSLAANHSSVVEVRGKGLLLAIQLNEDLARDVVERALSKGVLVNNVTSSAIRLCPPLIVTEEECDKVVAILDDVLADLAASGKEAK